MKKWIGYACLLVLSYAVFMLATLPASLVINKIKFPNTVSVVGIKGSIWHFTVDKIHAQNVEVSDVEATFNFSSLLTLDPQLSITFGGPLHPGPEGKFIVHQLFSTPAVKELSVLVLADQIAQQLPLPLPVKAHDYVALNLQQFVIDPQLRCQAVAGNLEWDKAAVTALEEKVILGKLSADLSCDQGALVVEIDPNNDLGLSYSAYISANGKFSGSGYLKPGAKFPEKLKQVLPFMGNPDNQGRYRLRM
ncbi:type II secretion system protein N [Thalassotalea agarivorans]|uniref:Type II secretion system protein N n=1 Tax=Thalassotalea agarivorans TaxID=349064 RepID=A0A1I0E4Q8_THASX|nr:type II secretion system protein N [Thalassotalea agarivorans]SET39979.1 type II secretion system protein N (GspN) [Thalassotalea agarivorans]